MHDMNENIKDISEIKKKLVKALDTEICYGMDKLDTDEAGKVADIIKDLAKAEKDCYEACYYKSIIEAMEEYGEEDGEKYGYNSRRYASGRYAPKGRGSVMGFGPMIPPMEKYFDTDDMNGRFGYSGGSLSRGDKGGEDSRYGRAYNDYQTSRRNYTTTNSETDKEKMNEHAREHVSDTVGTIREIWKNADVDLKKRIKQDLANLVNEMTV